MKYEYIKVYFMEDTKGTYTPPIKVHSLEELKNNLDNFSNYDRYLAVGHYKDGDEVLERGIIEFDKKQKKVKSKTKRKIRNEDGN